MTCPILILAAGQSSRMRGRDKLLEPVDGVPQLRRLAIECLSQSDAVFVALPRPDHPRASVLQDLNVTIQSVPDAAEGMSGTLRGAVRQLPKCDRFMLVLGDLVEVDRTAIAAVMKAVTPGTDVIWRGATQDGKPGHPIVFDASLRPEFDKLAGDGGAETLVNPLRHRTVLVPLPSGIARLDLDTPEEWTDWRSRTGR